jgi:hypothetical protein
MGRGLSDLQKKILTRALSNLKQDQKDGLEKKVQVQLCDTRYCDIYNFEIAADYFGWQSWRYAPDFLGPYDLTLKGIRARHDEFRRNAYCPPGTPRALRVRVHATIYRALSRLEHRRLGERRAGGFRLSVEGAKVARSLSASLHSHTEKSA